MSVSVILPTFNRAHMLGETLDSLLSQSRAPDEILVVDDGSTDGTCDLVAAFGPAVSYVFQENGGKAVALNRGLRQCRGELVWICDDDDILLPAACQTLAGALEADPALGFVAGRYLDFTVGPGTDRRQFSAPGYSPLSAPDEIFPDLLEGCHIFQPGLMVRRAAYDRVGPFNEALVRSQDYDMILRLARSQSGRLLDAQVFCHRVHAGPRGSAADRFDWADADAVWIRHNQKIFVPLLQELADDEVLPGTLVRGLDASALRRLAGFKRATVLARAQLWDEAIAGWTELAGRPGGRLDPVEVALIRRATSHAFGCADLIRRRDLHRSLRALSRQAPLGRAVVSELRRSLRWRARKALQQGRWRDGLGILRFWLSVG